MAQAQISTSRGSCFAAGRVGSVIGPLGGGLLVAQHVSLGDMFLIASIPLAIGFIAAAVLTPLYSAELRRQVAMAAGRRQDAWSGGAQARAET